MSDTVAIFVPSDAALPLDELFELSGNEAIEAQHAGERMVSARVTWDDVVLTFSVAPAAEQDEAVRAFQAQVDTLLGTRDDKRASKTRRRAERMIQVMTCTVEPDWDAGRKAQLLVQGIMEYYDYALMLAANAIYNENGNIEIGPPNSKLKYWAVIQEDLETGEALERKKRSIEALKKEGVPTIGHLPVVVDEANLRLRSAAEAIQRAAVLYFLSRFAEGETLQWFNQRVEQYRLQESVTAQEWEFVNQTEAPEYMVLRSSQRLESCWTLLWATGFVNRLQRPDSFCDEEYIGTIINTRSIDQLLLEARLRYNGELLDALDLHYRYHWAIVDAELYGKQPPRSLEPAVIYERHYALNWLTCHNDEGWDQVTTDT